MAFKVKNQIPSLEDLKIDEWYAITINPQDKYQRFNRQDRHNECLHDLRDKVIVNMDTYSYKLWPELSPKGRFHVHGIIKVDNKINFYAYCVPALLSRGTVVIKPLDPDTPGEWEKYCTKQIEYHEFLNEESVHVIPLEYSTNEMKNQRILAERRIRAFSLASDKLFEKRFNPVPVPIDIEVGRDPLPVAKNVRGGRKR